MHGLRMLRHEHEAHLNQGFIYNYSKYTPCANVCFLFDPSIYEKKKKKKRNLRLASCNLML